MISTHHSRFDVDERCIAIGVRTLTRTALAALSDSRQSPACTRMPPVSSQVRQPASRRCPGCRHRGPRQRDLVAHRPVADCDHEPGAVGHRLAVHCCDDVS